VHYTVINIDAVSFFSTCMVDHSLKLHTILILLLALFFLFTTGISFFLTMVLISTREYAADYMWIALIPPIILSVIFLQKVIGKLYNRLSVK
jgi:uncharacterized membrane protein YvlD (DUF360 family)